MNFHFGRVESMKHTKMKKVNFSVSQVSLSQLFKDIDNGKVKFHPKEPKESPRRKRFLKPCPPNYRRPYMPTFHKYLIDPDKNIPKDNSIDENINEEEEYSEYEENSEINEDNSEIIEENSKIIEENSENHSYYGYSSSNSNRSNNDLQNNNNKKGTLVHESAKEIVDLIRDYRVMINP